MVIQWAIIHIHTHTHIYIYIYITHMSSHVIQWGYFIYLIQLFLFSPIYQVDCTPDGVSGSYAQMDFLRERSAWFSLIPRISWREDMRVFFSDIWSFSWPVDFQNKSTALMTYEFSWFCWSNAFVCWSSKEFSWCPPALQLEVGL